MTEKTFRAGERVEQATARGARPAGSSTRWGGRRPPPPPAAIKAHKVAAPADNPEYRVVSGKTAARAAHRTSGLRTA